MEVYESEMYKKLRDYNEYVNKHPIKATEDFIGKLKWYQKIEVLYYHVKYRFEKYQYNKILRKLIR